MRKIFLVILLFNYTLTSCSDADTKNQNQESPTDGKQEEKAKGIKDYFLTEVPYNKVDFSFPKTKDKIIRYYINNDSTYTIKDSTYYRSELFKGRDPNLSTKTVTFVKDEVHVIQSSEYIFIDGPSVTEYKPPLVILKLPPLNETTKWTVNDPKDGLVKYEASWDEVTHKNDKKTAIKVVKSFDYTPDREVMYYVEGLGLYSHTIAMGSGVSIKKLQLDGVAQVAVLE